MYERGSLLDVGALSVPFSPRSSLLIIVNRDLKQTYLFMAIFANTSGDTPDPIQISCILVSKLLALLSGCWGPTEGALSAITGKPPISWLAGEPSNEGAPVDACPEG